MHKKAFTLVELMVTIALIAILSTIATTSYQGVQARGRDAQRQNDLAQLKLNLTSYYHAQIPTKFPTSATTTTLNGTSDILTTSLTPAYTRAVPIDPKNSGSYVYKYTSYSSASDYTLTATLENKNNSKGWGTGTQWVVDGYQIKPD